MNERNIKVTFERGKASINLHRDHCTITGKNGNTVTLTREQVLRFVQTVVGDMLDRECGERIGSIAQVWGEEDEE